MEASKIIIQRSKTPPADCNRTALPADNNHNNMSRGQSMFRSRRETESHDHHHLQPPRVIKLAQSRKPTLLSSSSNVVVAQHHLVISVIFLLLAVSSETHQQPHNFCPMHCTCDDQSLEIFCNGSLGDLSGLPITLNPNAERLTINNAQTSQLSGVEYMTRLKSLDLALNRLTLIDFGDITHHKMLISFNTSHNSISELKDSVVAGLMQEPDIATINFDVFDQQSESNLRKKLAKINVVDLDLSHNSLSILRNLTFIRWHKLQHLDLSYNQITILENHSLFGLSNLESISLKGNRLVQIPSIALQGTTRSIFNTARASQYDQSSLKYIELSGNLFVYVKSDAFTMVGNAQKIYLESCSIRSISERAFKGLRSLQTLALDNNFLEKIPSQSFSDLGALKVLTMNENNLSSIEAYGFSDLVRLQELQISGGSFKELEANTFNGLNNLQKLKITNNPNLLMIRPGTLGSMVKLAHLDLQSNSLPYVPPDANHDSLAFIDLRNNPLECGCDLRWLTGWLRRANESLQLKGGHTDSSLLMVQTFNLTCSGPAALAGQPVIDLPISKLECLEPSSELNILVGYATLFFISTILIVVCLINCTQNKKQLLTLLKENLVQNHLPAVSPYTMNLHKNIDNLKQETQLYSSDYENIDYGPQAQIYSVQGDQIMYYGPQQHQQQQLYSQQI